LLFTDEVEIYRKDLDTMANRRPRRRRRKKHTGLWPGLDVATLNAIAFLEGVFLIDGQPVPLVRPRGEPVDPMLFDDAVCDAGLKRFFRPIMPEDPAAGECTYGAEHLLVQEIAPGLHVQEAIQVSWPDDPERN
jgi:hypothetical protein